MSRPTQAIVSRRALQHNARLVRELAPQAKIMAVVKANAYGHGAVEVSRALAPHVDALAVACLEEALALRSAGLDSPILLLEGTFNTQELMSAAEASLWVTIENTAQLDTLINTKLAHPLHCWVKADTGMHRLGFAPDSVRDIFKTLTSSRNVEGMPVLFTHFADAETENSATTASQLSRFEHIPVEAPRSACNSAGVLALPQAHYDWVRPGYMLYGNSPLPSPTHATERLHSALTLCSRVSSVRQIAAGESVGYGANWVARRTTTIATLPIGYGDGYPRGTPAGTPVLINQQRAPLAGRVSMDMITVDVTDIGPVAIGDPAILWGDALPLHEIADHVGTNGYELTTRMGQRIARVYVND